jgi:hypothetical protein
MTTGRQCHRHFSIQTGYGLKIKEMVKPAAKTTGTGTANIRSVYKGSIEYGLFEIIRSLKPAAKTTGTGTANILSVYKGSIEYGLFEIIRSLKPAAKTTGR